MKVIILAGGFGSRLGSLTESLPKPMLEIGGKPILWHIMKYYSSYGFNDFVLLLGYKSRAIKEYFLNYNYISDNFKINLQTRQIDFSNNAGACENWNVTLLDTGLENLKGSRIKQAEPYIVGDLHFLTYGDGVCNVDINELLKFHKSHGKMITLTGVKPPSRFGELNLSGNQVVTFEEKPQLSSSGYINGGYMIFHKDLLKHLSLDKNCDFEFGPMEKLAKAGEVMMFAHNDFWECVDTERDLNHLNKLWDTGKANWKKW